MSRTDAITSEQLAAAKALPPAGTTDRTESGGASPPAGAADLERLGDEIAEIAAHIHAATHELLVRLAEFDRRGGWRGGFRSCAHWLSWRTGIALGAAREKVRVARALVSLPSLGESMRRGELSYAKARALTRIATPQNEPELLELARNGTASHIERVVRAWRRVDRYHEADEESRRHDSRCLTLYPDDDGSYLLRARLDPEVGAMLRRALDLAVRELWRRTPNPDGGSSPGKTRRSDRPAIWPTDVSAETSAVGDHGTSAGLDASIDGTRPDDPSDYEEPVSDPTKRTTGLQRQADALALIVECALRGELATSLESSERGASPIPADRAEGISDRAEGNADRREGSADRTEGNANRADGNKEHARGRKNVNRADRFQVVLHVDAEALRDGSESGQCVLEGGVRVSAETSRRLACDSSRVVMASDANGEVLDVGRRTRTVPPAIRRALEHRDRGCRFPGCDARFCDAHHIRHWADGGATRLDNLVLLCRLHHRAVHEGGYRVVRSDSGEIRFLRPDRKWLPVVPAAPRISAVALNTLRDRRRAEGIDIHPWTPTPSWRGEPLDLDFTIQTMWRPREHAG